MEQKLFILETNVISLDFYLITGKSQFMHGLAYTLSELYPEYIEITPDAVVIEPHMIHKMNMLHLN